MLNLTELKKYKYDLEHYEGFKTLQKYKNKFYVYKGIIIDSKWHDEDLKDEISDDFDPFYNKGYTRQLGKGSDATYDYVPDFILLNYEKDIENFKDDIIKYIDDKELCSLDPQGDKLYEEDD